MRPGTTSSPERCSSTRTGRLRHGPERSRVLANDARLPAPRTHPGGAARDADLPHPSSELPELSELLARVLRDGRASTIKLTCRTKSGTFLPTEISLHALEIGGRIRVLGLVQDRSEHRR